MKTNGQRAYEAYFAKAGGKSLVSGAPLPKWEEQKPEIQESWEAAAEAVQPQFEAVRHARRSDEPFIMDQESAEQMFKRFAEEAQAEAEDPQNPVPRFGTPEYAQWVAKNVAQTPPSVHRLLKNYRDAAEQLQVQLAGCGVAALGGTKDEQVAKQGDYGWSPAYEDVLKLRREVDTACRLLEGVGLLLDLERSDDNGPQLARRVAALVEKMQVHATNEENVTRAYQGLDKKYVTVVGSGDAEALAQRFHETYERLAPSFGYKTREASAKPWAEVPENNRKLMTAVCAEILGDAASHSGLWRHARVDNASGLLALNIAKQKPRRKGR